MKEEEIDLLLSKYFAGEAGKEEEVLIEQWKNSSEANARYYSESQRLFVQIDLLKDKFEVDSDAAWQKLNARISEGEAKIIPFYSQKRFLRAAASIFLLVTLGFILNALLKGEKELEYVSQNESVQSLLPDGSKVQLNPHSELTYVELNKNERHVKLKGSAHFTIKHDANKAFVIEVEDVFIKDIGTVFNVREDKHNSLIEVSVEEGEVQFYSQHNNGLNLKASEQATFNKLTKEFIRLTPVLTKQVLPHYKQMLHFNNSALADVINQINTTYHCRIQLENEKIGKCRLSVNFENEDLDVLLSVIAETLDLKISKQQDSTILLSGKPCAD